MNSEKKPYFGSLDTLRTYAFLLVFISHAYFSFFKVTNFGTRWFAHGEVGVQMFFVLSAFLITYLSLSEYKKTGDFSVGNFFKKRILRIWPVYFLVLSISYVWHNVSTPGESIGCMYRFVYFLGNTCILTGLPNTVGVGSVGPLWSISVEQQFYILFPIVLMVYIIGTQTYKPKVLRSIIHVVLWSMFAYGLYARYIQSDNWNYVSYSIFSSVPAFISGMYLAYLLHIRARCITHIQKNAHVYALSAVISFISFLYIKFTGAIGISLYILPVIYTTCIWIILATDTKGSVEQVSPGYHAKITRHLGKISYGLYAYHMFAIIVVQALFGRGMSILESVLAFSITIVFAQISYTYIESFFLKFKKSML